MRPHVHFPDIRGRERPAAVLDRALERLLPGMSAHVFLEIAGRFEVLVAPLAAVRFLAGVSARVRLQGVAGSECLVAAFFDAVERTMARVGSHVDLTKATADIFIRFT